MATIYASPADGYVNASYSDWATARDATTGGGSNNSVSGGSNAINGTRDAARGGGYIYRVSRVFMFFSTSVISSNVASATLKIYGYSQSSADVIAVKATSDIGTITTADYDAITGWSTGSADGSRGGDNESNVTKYSDELTSWSTSGISSNVASATLKIYGYGQNSARVIAVKSTSDIGTVTTADYDAITGWSTGSADGSGGGDNESNVTKYSDELTSWSTSGYNDFTLTGTALANMRDDNYLYVCIMETVHDLRDIAPTGTSRNGCYFADSSGTSKDPYIDYTLAPTVTDNAVFFGCNF